MNERNQYEVLRKLPKNERRAIIQSLGQTTVLDDCLEKLSSATKDKILPLLELSLKDPQCIPGLRYELETYTNDLDPGFSDEVLELSSKKNVRTLDVGAGPGDVTLRGYEQLSSTGNEPIIVAIENSRKFVNEIKNTAQDAGIESRELQFSDLAGIANLKPGIYPISGDALFTLKSIPRGILDLLTANYVLDRLPQRSFLNNIGELNPKNIQSTNCIPLQYANPNTGEEYLEESEIVIPRGARSLAAVGNVLKLENIKNFSGKNTVSSLQDGEEEFDCAGISARLINS